VEGKYQKSTGVFILNKTHRLCIGVVYTNNRTSQQKPPNHKPGGRCISSDVAQGCLPGIKIGNILKLLRKFCNLLVVCKYTNLILSKMYECLSIIVQFLLFITAAGIGIASIVNSTKDRKLTYKIHRNNLEKDIEYNKRSVTPIINFSNKVSGPNEKIASIDCILKNYGIGPGIIHEIIYEHGIRKINDFGKIIEDSNILKVFGNRLLDSHVTVFPSEHAIAAGGEKPLISIKAKIDNQVQYDQFISAMTGLLKQCKIRIKYSNIYYDRFPDVYEVIWGAE